jgi:hypothetical protein
MLCLRNVVLGVLTAVTLAAALGAAAQAAQPPPRVELYCEPNYPDGRKQDLDYPNPVRIVVDVGATLVQLLTPTGAIIVSTSSTYFGARNPDVSATDRAYEWSLKNSRGEIIFEGYIDRSARTMNVIFSDVRGMPYSFKGICRVAEKPVI